MNNLFLGYDSRYAGSFDLSDTIKYPKMCADKSVNMTDGVTYYRGQEEFPYIIGEHSNSANIINMMGDNPLWMF
jgi:hypothetical protein